MRMGSSSSALSDVQRKEADYTAALIVWPVSASAFVLLYFAFRTNGAVSFPVNERGTRDSLLISAEGGVSAVKPFGTRVRQASAGPNLPPQKNSETPFFGPLFDALRERLPFSVNTWVLKRKLRAEPRKSLRTWLREISSCSCLNFLPGPAWVLLSKICKDFFSALYCAAATALLPPS